MPQQGCSTHCQAMPVVMGGQVIVPSKFYPVTDTIEGARIGEAALFPEYAIPENLLLYELPNGKRFEKHRVFWAGMLRNAWLRVE